jgi:polar amino acid transport system substrate-binding protein
MRRSAHALACALFALAGCQREEPPAAPAPQAAAPDERCTLRVGWDPWEPYQFESADGSVRGLDVEIIRGLAGAAGCEATFVRGSWGALLDEVRAGKIDVLMAATPTPEREAYAWFSPPYRQESFALFTRAEDGEALAGMDLAELVRSGRKIGITEGYYYGEAATQLILGEDTAAAFVSAPLVELSYTRLVDGEIDALLDDPFVAAAVLRRKGWSDVVVRHPLEIHSGEVSMMYSKAGVQRATVEQLDAALAARKADGSLQRLIERYRG